MNSLSCLDNAIDIISLFTSTDNGIAKEVIKSRTFSSAIRLLKKAANSCVLNGLEKDLFIFFVSDLLPLKIFLW